MVHRSRVVRAALGYLPFDATESSRGIEWGSSNGLLDLGA
jgi:hypothetical protein